MKKILFFIAASTLSCNLFAITPFEASYKFAYNGKNLGSATRTLSQKNQNWNYVFTATAGMIASASEKSSFNLNKGIVDSKDFSRTSKILVHQDNMSIHFDANKHVISTQKKEKKRSFQWQPNVLDELNAEVQIREDLINNRLRSTYLLTDAKGIDERQFIKEGTEQIQTNYGTFEAIKVRMQHSRPDRNTIFWLAPKLDYLPVKIVHNDDGTSYGLTLTNYKKF
ncbi:DUF3108 domain-containing protein [Acinetobacter sp. HY1485]|uniref:DUF3108 domain-containing protein n=1 Tax=Acinetobacter sp. HY1485 TaxID=2970918 RepID=UPI0022B9573B|nr:DUF3108 domain-containing protein [Acinetobacter sp. HY1485]